jgi:hypothetical protein
MKSWMILLMVIVGISNAHAQETTADVPAVVNLILRGDPEEASKAACRIRFHGPSGELCTFAEKLFERVDKLSDEEESRLGAAITALGHIGDEYAAKMLSHHLRWQARNFQGNGRNRIYEDYACAMAMVQIGGPALTTFADILAESDTDETDCELEIKIARSGIQAIGSHMLRGKHGGDPKPGILFAKAYLESAAALNENAKQAQRLRKSAAYFAAELEKIK